jgi:glutamine amidotransferase
MQEEITELLPLAKELVDNFDPAWKDEKGAQIKVPHMGWNTISGMALDHPLWRGIEDNAHFYFVHSYYVPLTDATMATCEYGIEFSAALKKDNFYGCQFHPEKSGEVGERILKRFLEL